MLLKKEKESRVKFNPGLSANRPSNNWAQRFKTLNTTIIRQFEKQGEYELYLRKKSERPGNSTGPKANFKVKTFWIVAQSLAYKPVNFASLTDSFITSISKLLEPWSWMQTRQIRNSSSGPKSYRDFQETGPAGTVRASSRPTILP